MMNSIRPLALAAILGLIHSFAAPSVVASQGQAPAPKKADPHAGHAANATAPVTGFEAAPKGSRVFFVNLKNKQTVAKKLLVKFGVEGMKILPAGEMVSGTGHHHLIIDGTAVAPGHVVPADERHIHFGKGQTEAEIELKPGNHKLTLQFANGAHLSYGPELSETIDVTVK